MFTGKPEILAQFGLVAPKARTKLTSEALLQRKVNAQATRAARVTVGPKKKLAIKGNAPSVVVPPSMPVVITNQAPPHIGTVIHATASSPAAGSATPTSAPAPVSPSGSTAPAVTVSAIPPAPDRKSTR